MASWIAKTSKAALPALLALAGGATLLHAALAGAQTIETERAALARAKAEASAAQARARGLDAQAAAEQGEAGRVQIEAASIAARIQAAEAGIDAAEARVRLVERMQADLQAQLAEKQEPAVRLVAALQTLSRRPPLLALVQPGSLRDMVHVRATLDALLPEVRRRTAGLRADLDKGRQLRLDAEQAVGALGESRAQLARERTGLVQLAARHREASRALSGSAIVEQDRAVAMGEKARDIDELIGQLNSEADVRDRLAGLPGPLLRPGNPSLARALPSDTGPADGNRLPYRLPVGGTLVTGLGEVSATGVRARGLTIATRAGAQVVAPAGGRIVYAGPFRGFGEIVIIDHGRGWTTLVANMAARDVQVGDRVVDGSPLGRAGGDRPRVTVELRRNMRPIDIAWLLG